MHVRELRVPYLQRRVSSRCLSGGCLGTPKACADLFTQILGAEVVELCGMVCLSTKDGLIAYHQLSRGTLDTTVVGHNHPSGVVQPSPDDIALTRRLAAASEVMGVVLADHIIVSGSGEFYSFRDAARL